MMLTQVAVIQGALETLGRYHQLASRLSKRALVNCVDAAWDAPPHPLVFFLWLASSDLAGKEQAGLLLDSTELVITVLPTGKLATGAWQSRVNRLFPPRRGANFHDHYANFQSALFELVMAFRMYVKDAPTRLNGENDTSVCDISVVIASNELVAAEAYAPRKWAERVYEDEVAAPWKALIAGNPLPQRPQPGSVRDLGLDPDAVARHWRTS